MAIFMKHLFVVFKRKKKNLFCTINILLGFIIEFLWNVIHTLGQGWQMMDPFGLWSNDFYEIFSLSFFLTRDLNGGVRFDLVFRCVFSIFVYTDGNLTKTKNWIHHLPTWPQGVDDIYTWYCFVELSQKHSICIIGTSIYYYMACNCMVK